MTAYDAFCLNHRLEEPDDEDLKKAFFDKHTMPFGFDLRVWLKGWSTTMETFDGHDGDLHRKVDEEVIPLYKAEEKAYMVAWLNESCPFANLDANAVKAFKDELIMYLEEYHYPEEPPVIDFTSYESILDPTPSRDRAYYLLMDAADATREEKGLPLYREKPECYDLSEPPLKKRKA